MITLRWDEYCFYDPIEDMEVLRLQAITNKGTWYTDVDANEGVRANRKRFKERALEVIGQGTDPGWVDLDEEVEA